MLGCPADDGASGVVSETDEDGEGDDEGDGVAVVETVHEVIIVLLRLRAVLQRRNQTRN